ncbi:MAG: argininosuccinate lyase [Ruminococcaceae bacterium]|nr:argininosuccinate lyase [Oscillospiraceae bacterium]
MKKLWEGRAKDAKSILAEEFNSSIKTDSRLFKQDIRGSIAHAEMLSDCGIISSDEKALITDCLKKICREIENGELIISTDAEDIHSFVENELTIRLGDSGRKLHTARSRNDQVATSFKLYLKDETDEIINLLSDLIEAIAKKAVSSKDIIMPGYTHMQRAQPITFAQHLLAYGMMFARDLGRLKDAVARMNISPLGACALAGTAHPINPAATASALGFSSPFLNSIDAVSDRDFCVELTSALSLIMTHLSRFSEEIIIWATSEFSFISLSDAYTTGSSIMPQKKNPDIAELIRGKTGRVYGSLIALLTMLKALPLAYNKDMQEDKDSVFDAFDTVKKCLTVFIPMLNEIRPNADKMLNATKEGFLNATDVADYLCNKGMPFRSAYALTGKIVDLCSSMGTALEDLPLIEYKKFSELFEADLYQKISAAACVNKRNSPGGTSSACISPQIEYLESVCEKSFDL